MKNKLTYLIDDDKLSVKLVSLLLQKNDFCEEIQSFHNPLIALDNFKKKIKADEYLPDVVLLDLNMPVMDGWQFLDEFIDLPLQKKISVFILTSSIDPFDIEMAKNYPLVKSYIMKPITYEKLEAINQLLNR